MWPAYATLIGHLDGWIGGVWLQTHRIGAGLLFSLNYNFKIDALFMIVGFGGLVYSVFRRDIFILLWAVPLLVFFYFIGFVSFWHIIPLIPVFSISAAVMIIELSRSLYNFRILTIILVSGIVLIVGITGFQHTINLATSSNNDHYYEATTFISDYLRNHKQDKLTIMSDAFYRWIPRYVFDLTVDYQDYTNPLPTNNSILLVVDDGFLRQMQLDKSLWNGSKFLKYYYYSNDSDKLVTFSSDKSSSNNVSIFLYSNKHNG